FFNRSPHDWSEAFDRMIFVDNVPNLHQIRFLFGQFSNELPCLIRRIDFDNRWIAEIEFLARNAGDQWTGDRHSRRLGGLIRGFADLEIPKWSANINNTRNATPQITLKDIIHVTLHPRDFVFVGANTVKIGAVRPGKQIAGLKEV